MLGDLFKQFFSVEKLGYQPEKLYVFPDSDLEIEYPDFDELIFPTG